MKRVLLLFCPLLAALCLLPSCATAPKTYLPPDAAKLKASTQRVSKAVDAAHQSARKAQSSVNDAASLAKKNREAVGKIKNVPPEVLQGLADQESKLAEAQANQKELEIHLTEADQAKIQVEADKTEYFNAAQKLADSATSERNSRIKDENSLHWYRMHWWGSWVVLGLGVIASIIFGIIKFAGKLPFP